MPQASTCCQWQTLLSLTKRPGYFAQWMSNSFAAWLKRWSTIHQARCPTICCVVQWCRWNRRIFREAQGCVQVWGTRMSAYQHSSCTAEQEIPRESTVSLNPGWSVRWAVWWWSSSPSLPTQCEWALCAQDDPPWLSRSVIRIIQSSDVASYFSGPLGRGGEGFHLLSFKFPPQILTKFVCLLGVFHIFSPHKSNSPPNYVAKKNLYTTLTAGFFLLCCTGCYYS